MSNKIYYDFIDKINLIFDFFYNINTSSCFSHYKITLGKIDINDIKFSIPSNKEDEEIYTIQKNNILEGKYKLLIFDENNNEFLFKCYNKNSSYPVLIKICFYKKKNTINNLNNEINNDNLFSYILSSLVLNKKTKHILLPIINIDINFTELENIIKNDIFIYQKIKFNLNSNNITDLCCFQIRENFFKTINLIDYIKDNYCDIQVLLFQIIHTLAVIDNNYKDFKHNNLLINNILLYIKRETTSYSIYEGFKKDNFYIINKGFDIKIYNFNHSTIPKYYEYSSLSNNNKLHDIKTFINDLLKNIDIDKICDKNTKKFMDKIILNKDNELTLVDLLYDDFFADYKKIISDKKNIEETLYNHLYLTGNFNTTINYDNYLILGNQKLLNNKKSNNIIMTRFIKNENAFIENKLHRKSKYINDTFEDLYDDKVQFGGDGFVDTKVAPFKTERNTPFISNDERETYNKKKKEEVSRELPVLLEQKIYDTSVKQPKPQPPSPYIPINTPYVPLYDKYGNIEDVLPYVNKLNHTPVQKLYTINLTNPLNHTTISKIYEDVLPQNLSALTVYERSELINYLRNNMINKTDGEEMTDSTTLLSYIKFLELNPYSINVNPYHDLPNNFLLYKAAYPVRYDESSKNITIGKDSMAINVRMYMLTIGDLSCINICMDLTHDDFDVWREIKYYNWVREKIMKNKISPNFIAPILYKIDPESKINWHEVELSRRGNVHNGINSKLIDNTLIINKSFPIKKKYGLFDYLLNSKTKPIKPLNAIKDDDEIEDLTIYSGKSLILLTEAPTTSIYKWSSKLYNQFGSVKKMIATGYHPPDVWKSILFQLVYACAVLQKSKIYINNLSLNNNVYIKDISYNPSSIGSWIYKVNNINYYIPNYGYILLIDSKYTNIDIEDNLLNIKPINIKQKYKIYGSIYNKNFDFDMNQIEIKIKEQFKNLINPDNFTHHIRINGGTIPDENIRDLLRNMYNDSETNIINYLSTYFLDFIHNKIGLPLNKSEFDLINIISGFNNIIEGAIVPCIKRHNYYEWVLFKNKDPLNYRIAVIIVKENNKFVEKNVSIASLKRYPEIVQQDNKNNFKYDENYIYETYDFSKI